MPNNFRTNRATSPRVAAIAAVAMATLFVSVLPASGTASASVGTDQAPRQITAEPRPGARSVTLSPAQRRKLLEAATEARVTTARSLKLSDQEELIPKDVVKDADGTVHTRYERTYAGLPVIGGDLVVHEQGAARTVTKASAAKVSVPTTKAAVTAATAKKSALAAAKTKETDDAATDGSPKLVVWLGGSKPTLAWQTVVSGVQEDGTPSSLSVLTDATTGKQLQSVEQVHSGTGHSQYSGEVPIGTMRNGSLYELTDPERGGHKTYDLTGVGGSGVLVTDDDDVWGDGTAADRQTAAVDAAYGQRQTWDFYHDRFGRNGIADDGVGAYSRVHYGDGYANAFWDNGCFCMTYGDGLNNARPLTELDIAAPLPRSIRSTAPSPLTSATAIARNWRSAATV
ncbi:M4 family metallopeptidase, partial [Streptomyces sp. NPDC005093]